MRIPVVASNPMRVSNVTALIDGSSPRAAAINAATSASV
jgi:hypothetical protein